jgi:S-adenosylmethionine:tRNA ribosyltransferase-isomerase
VKTDELNYSFPERLIATERRSPSRVMLVRDSSPQELSSMSELMSLFRAGDCLVVNDTRVLKRRVFSDSDLEILFLEALNVERTRWNVLCPSSRWKSGTEQCLPGGAVLNLARRGRPQEVQSDRPLSDEYFEQFGELPLPPYIQKARGERRNRAGDGVEYQTAWAKVAGSLAAPTASLHFTQAEVAELKVRGVEVESITLHVGLGTFLPVTVDVLDEHVMHAELVSVDLEVWKKIEQCKQRGGRVWALGTTVARSLESVALGRLPKSDSAYLGPTDLFIRPGFNWRVCDVLMTNFHQPRSTLLALVSAFSSIETVKNCYSWAIEREFRLFSYGDLSIWLK